MAVELLGACPDMGFSKAWLAHMSYAGGASKDAQALTLTRALTLTPTPTLALVLALTPTLALALTPTLSRSPTPTQPLSQAAHRRRLGAFMEQIIGRPVADDRVLDLSFCAELGAAGTPHRPRTTDWQTPG